MWNRVVLRELLPYMAYTVVWIFAINLGIFAAASIYGGDSGNYLAVMCIVDGLMLCAGAGLLLWQLFYFVLPTQNILCHMDRVDNLKKVSGEIIGTLDDYKACKVRLDQMESIVQTDFMDRLLNAEFKSKPQLLAEADNVGIALSDCRYLVIMAGIFSNVADEDVDAATIHESTAVLDRLKAEMSWGGVFSQRMVPQDQLSENVGGTAVAGGF